MGLANLVPGISGGTMLLAAGIYPRFIGAVADVTSLRLQRESLLVLLAVVGAAALAILMLAGTVKTLVVEHRWAMYSLFIGLTLGGVPVLWRLIGRPTPGLWLAVVSGFLAMAALAMAQGADAGSADRSSFVYLLLAGTAGSAAMILPGVSGGYLLLVLGVYVPILAGLAALKTALGHGDLGAIWHLGLTLVLPVGLGVVIGLVAVSHLLRWLLARCEKATLGVLLGLLLGAVLGLWPFQHGVAPDPGTRIKGQTVMVSETGELYLQSSMRPLQPEDYPTQLFRPGITQIGASLALVLLGFGLTMALDRLGGAAKRSE